MEAIIIQNDLVFDVVVDGETVFTHADNMTCYQWASEHGLKVT